MKPCKQDAVFYLVSSATITSLLSSAMENDVDVPKGMLGTCPDVPHDTILTVPVTGFLHLMVTTD
jgi:hypothetical protein